MKKILVTGANGQLGSCIKKIAQKYRNIKPYFVDAEAFNLTDYELMSAFFEKKDSYDYCVNCASKTEVDLAESQSDKFYKVNAQGVFDLAKICKSHNTVLVHISTDYVFDGKKLSPYKVTDVPNPINVYGASKLAGEEYIKTLMSDFFIIRTSWLYCEFGVNFYTTILKKLQSGDTLKVVNDQYGSPTNANHLAECILDLISSGSKNFGLHHYCGDLPMSWYEFSKKIATENNLKPTQITPVPTSAFKTIAKRPKYTVLERTL